MKTNIIGSHIKEAKEIIKDWYKVKHHVPREKQAAIKPLLQDELAALLILWKDSSKKTIHNEVKETILHCSSELEKILKDHEI
jgi:hypothetical protein